MKPRVLLAILAMIFAFPAATATGFAGTTERVSVSSARDEGNGESQWPSVSAGGRYVAFHSAASNLVPDDTNGCSDVFVHDRTTGVTERVSVSNSGGEGNGWCSDPVISANGRYVAFASYASNLVPADTNGCMDVFVHDRLTGTSERVSLSSTGEQANGQGNYWKDVAISADGRFVVFASSASNLVPGDTNGMCDIFLRDRDIGVTERISVGSSGEQSNGSSGYWSLSVTPDGRYVAFPSLASNLVPGDTNGAQDIFVRDRVLGVTERVSIGPDGQELTWSSRQLAMSADGRYVAFTYGYSQPLLLYVRDRIAGVTTAISDAGNDPAMTPDGRYVAYWWGLGHLAEDTVRLYDRVTGLTEDVSVGTDGVPRTYSHYPTISADGRYVAFDSGSPDLVPGDSNWVSDIFVRDRWGAPSNPVGPYPSEDEWSSYYPHRGQLHAHYMPDGAYRLVGGIPVGVALGPVPAAGGPMSAARSNLATLYGLCGYDFIAITEHQPDSKFSDCTWDKVFEDASTDGVLSLLGSAEDTQPPGGTHILGIGFGTGIDSGVMGGDGSLEHLEQRLANIKNNGGVAIVAHPDVAEYRWSDRELRSFASLYNGMELYNTAAYYGTLISTGGWDWAALDQGFAVDTWDRLLATGAANVRAVWGTAGDDYTPNIYQGWAWLDDACVVVWTTSPTPDQEQIKEALRAGRFYACKGGSDAPEILAYWVDPGMRTITVQLPQPFEVTFVRGRWGRKPVIVGPTDRGDGTYVASYSYASDDIYIRTEVRDSKGNTSWLQPIWIDQLQTMTGSFPAAPPAGFHLASVEPLVLEMDGARLTVSAPQSELTYVNGELLVGDARPPAPPLGYLSRCYQLTPDVTLQGTNTLTISYFPDSVHGFPESSLAVYRYDTAGSAWYRLGSVVEASGAVIASISQLGVYTVSAEQPVDTETPSVAITSPGGGDTISDPAIVTVDAADDQGVADVHFYLDGWPLGDDEWGGDGWTAQLDPVHYTAGERVLSAVADDGAGNESTAEITVTVAGLMLAPVMTISSPAEAEVVWGDLRANGTWSGQLPMALGVFTLDDQPLTASPPADGPWQVSVAMAPEQVGDRTLKATGFDIYGNRAEASVPVLIRVFSDIPLGFWARDHIYAAARAGIVHGYDDGTYKPDLAVTRGQMAVYMSRAMAGGDGNVPDDPDGTPFFPDVAADYWAYKYVEYCHDHGIVQGYWDGYRPEETVDRGQMAVYVARSRGWVQIGDDMTTAPELFPDVPAGFWAGTAIAACVVNGVVHGYDDGYYRPDWTVTRDQMAVYVARAFALPL